MSNVAERLYQKFGGGTRPDLRAVLYSRLEALVEQEDPRKSEAAYAIIAAVVADAESKASPGNYFAYVVTRRLQEKGIVLAPSMSAAF